MFRNKYKTITKTFTVVVVNFRVLNVKKCYLSPKIKNFGLKLNLE
jgi:hypothetical protein